MLSMAHDLYLAVEGARGVADVENADVILNTILNTLQKIEMFLRLQVAKRLSWENALKVVASLKESKVDYMLLLYLLGWSYALGGMQALLRGGDTVQPPACIHHSSAHGREE